MTTAETAQVAVSAIGDLTIVEDFEALETVVNAYRTSDIALVWSHRTWPNVYYYACDTHLCQTGDAPASAAVIDPRTGAVIGGPSRAGRARRSADRRRHHGGHRRCSNSCRTRTPRGSRLRASSSRTRPRCRWTSA